MMLIVEEINVCVEVRMKIFIGEYLYLIENVCDGEYCCLIEI